MKLALKVKLAFFTTIAFTSVLFSCRQVQAANYSESEVDQTQFIAVAVPFGNRQYNLMVIEQIAGKSQCWSESGSQPVTVEALLLNFDFSGSCRRATDSNGYSIRIDGQDYGLDYLLSILERDGELLLVGTPRGRKSNRSEIVVGRSYGINPGLNKIFLNSGWRFTKRTFEAKTLGHIYFTGNTVAMNSSKTATNNTLPTQLTTEREIVYNAPDIKSPISTELPSSQPKGKFSEVIVDVPVPSDKINSDGDNSVDKLLVPDIPIPVSTPSQSSKIPVASRLPAKSYRVMVQFINSSQESQVRSLYPQTFPTVHQGQSMLQIGNFSQRQNAETAFQNIQNLGWDGIILEN